MLIGHMVAELGHPPSPPKEKGFSDERTWIEKNYEDWKACIREAYQQFSSSNVVLSQYFQLKKQLKDLMNVKKELLHSSTKGKPSSIYLF